MPHRDQPIFYAPAIDYYVLTSYDDIAAVFRDPASYSAAVAQAPLGPITEQAQKIRWGAGHKPQPSMVSLDEPEHARLRKPTARAFSMKRVTAMVPTIEATTARLLDAVAGEAEFDLVAALAFPLPANIVFSLMGVPEQDFASAQALVRLPGSALAGGGPRRRTRSRSPPAWPPTAATCATWSTARPPSPATT